MSTFCLATMIAIGFDFLFEIILFTPCMVLSSKLSCIRPPQSHLVLSDVGGKEAGRGGRRRGTAWHRYAQFVASKWGRGVCFLVLSSLYIFSYFGARKIQATFQPKKSFPSDSALVDSTRVLNRIYSEV